MSPGNFKIVFSQAIPSSALGMSFLHLFGRLFNQKEWSLVALTFLKSCSLLRIVWVYEISCTIKVVSANNIILTFISFSVCQAAPMRKKTFNIGRIRGEGQKRLLCLVQGRKRGTQKILQFSIKMWLTKGNRPTMRFLKDFV